MTLESLFMQVGFVIALAAEAAGPVRGIFGAWDQQSLSLFGASALILIACAAVSCLHTLHSCCPAQACKPCTPAALRKPENHVPSKPSGGYL